MCGTACLLFYRQKAALYSYFKPHGHVVRGGGGGGCFYASAVHGHDQSWMFVFIFQLPRRRQANFSLLHEVGSLHLHWKVAKTEQLHVVLHWGFRGGSSSGLPSCINMRNNRATGQKSTCNSLPRHRSLIIQRPLYSWCDVYLNFTQKNTLLLHFSTWEIVNMPNVFLSRALT